MALGLTKATSTQERNEIFFFLRLEKDLHLHDNGSIKYPVRMGTKRRVKTKQTNKLKTKTRFCLCPQYKYSVPPRLLLLLVFESCARLFSIFWSYDGDIT